MLRSMKGLTDTLRAALWQAWSLKSKGSGNPFGTSTGDSVYSGYQRWKSGTANAPARAPRSAVLRPEPELDFDPYDGRGYYTGLRLPG